jgi:predicted MFS family arabinose efflux permease
MLSFAVILLISPVHGYAASGAVLAVVGVGQTIGAPLWGRRVDGAHPAAVLLGTGAAQSVALAAMSVAGGSVTLSLALGAVVGLATPPLTPSVRAMLPRLVPPDRTAAAYALESTLQEMVFVAGPLLAGLLATLWGAGAAFVATALLTSAGTAGYVAAARRVPRAAEGLPAPGSAERRAPMVAALRRELAGGALFLVVLCLESVALVGRVSGAAAVPGASWYLAATSVGSIAGGLVVGSRLAPDEGPRRRFAYLAVGLVPVLVCVALPDPVGAWLLAPAAFLVGTTIAPVATTLFQGLSRVAAAGRQTEAFGWMGAAMGVGGVVGDAAGGWLVAHPGPAVALLAAAVAAGAGVAASPGRYPSLPTSPSRSFESIRVDE